MIRVHIWQQQIRAVDIGRNNRVGEGEVQDLLDVLHSITLLRHKTQRWRMSVGNTYNHTLANCFRLHCREEAYVHSEMGNTLRCELQSSAEDNLNGFHKMRRETVGAAYYARLQRFDNYLQLLQPVDGCDCLVQQISSGKVFHGCEFTHGHGVVDICYLGRKKDAFRILQFR